MSSPLDAREPDSQAPSPGRDAHAAEILLQVCNTVCGNFDVGRVLRSATDVTAKAMDAEASSILLETQDAVMGGQFFDIVETGRAGNAPEARLPVDDASIAGWAAGHGQALLVPDVSRDDRFNPRYDSGAGVRVRSMICVPLRVAERQLGVIEILNRRDGKPFDESDMIMLEAVAGLISKAIDRAAEYQTRLGAERLATVGRTIAEAAHFIKNVLNGLESGAYAIDRNLEGDQNSALVAGWRTVKRNMQLLRKIVQDMLSYSKQREPARQPCSVAGVCHDVVDLLGQQAKDKSVELVCEGQSDLPEMWIDEGAIRRCLVNLVSNAVDACGEKGGLVQIEVRPANSSGFFSIRVRDNGCGIDPAMQEEIFEPFYSTKGSEGTGLGLAVTKKIVEEHDGSIRVDSRPGEGTEFALLLPIRHKKEGAEA